MGEEIREQRSMFNIEIEELRREMTVERERGNEGEVGGSGEEDGDMGIEREEGEREKGGVGGGDGGKTKGDRKRYREEGEKEVKEKCDL